MFNEKIYVGLNWSSSIQKTEALTNSKYHTICISWFSNSFFFYFFNYIVKNINLKLYLLFMFFNHHLILSTLFLVFWSKHFDNPKGMKVIVLFLPYLSHFELITSVNLTKIYHLTWLKIISYKEHCAIRTNLTIVFLFFNMILNHFRSLKYFGQNKKKELKFISYWSFYVV